MLKVWTVLLLCGLLPLSQGVIENVLSLAQLDTSVLENVVSGSVAQGDLLKGVLGTGLLDGVLRLLGLGGQGGLLGGLLGGQGGLLGGVLGGQNGGLVGGILGGQGGNGLGGLTGGIVGGQEGGGLLGGVTGGLTGGLLDGVLGGQNGGLVGGILGGQGGNGLGGLTGGIVGGQEGGGLLGGVTGGLTGGLLDGVLGGQNGGLVGGILGGQGGNGLGGLTGGIVGGQDGGGLLGGLTGGLTGGLLDGVLGGQNGGLLGGILGGQGGNGLGGLTGGIMGGQGGGGLLGGLTGGLTGGLLDGVLGGQNGGLIGGILGGKGGNGLLGGLTGGIAGGQGRNELLGGLTGGLLDGVLGGQGLLGLKIVDIILPKVSMKLLEGVGVDLNLYAKVELKGGNMPLIGMLNLMVEVNITGRARLVQDKTGAPILVLENCKTLLGGVEVLSGLIPLNLDRVVVNLLNNLLPGLLCPVIDLVVNLLNTVLSTVNSVCPFGMLGQLHYTLAGLPLFQGQHLLLNLNLMIIDPEGKTISLPPVQMPSLPVPAGHSSQLLLPGELFSTLLSTLGSKGLLNTDITEQTLRGNVPLTTSALQSLVPEISQLGAPSSLPLVVKIRLSGQPKLALKNGQASLTLKTAIEVLARTRSGLKPLFEVAATLGLSGKFKAASSKLMLTFALDTLDLKLASSEIGEFNIAVLENWIKNLIVTEYLSVVNGALEIGIPLPNLFNMKFDAAAVSVLENSLLLDVTPKLL